MSASAAQIVAQHARTAQLMGVDFMPVSVATPAPAARPEQGVSAAGSVGGASEGADVHAGAGGRDREAIRAKLAAINARYEAAAPHASFTTAHNKLVFGDGDPGARVMFVGEAPGADEDRIGRPFVGRAGQLLDKMIVAMGLSRAEVYISNVLKTRPPNNATPTLEEAALCLPYLLDEIDAIRPEALVTLGLTATRALLQTEESMGRMRGHWTTLTHPQTKSQVAVMPTFHPAFLLRQYTDENRGKVWSDLKQVMDKLGLKAPKRG